MNFDIEKLERKTLYKTPDHFFDAVQNKVLAETVHKKKDAKIIPLFAKWAVAASVTLVAGLSAFYITSQDEQINIAKNEVIIDSTYNPKQSLALHNTPTTPENYSDDTEQQTTKPESGETIIKNTPNTKKEISTSRTIETKASFAKANINTDSKVNRALAVFTPDQISEMDKSIDQDVYLDLYN